MTSKKPAEAGGAITVIANDPDDRKGRLKKVGGSLSDHWNNTLVNQAVQTLWVENSDGVKRDRQMSAIARRHEHGNGRRHGWPRRPVGSRGLPADLDHVDGDDDRDDAAERSPRQ